MFLRRSLTKLNGHGYGGNHNLLKTMQKMTFCSKTDYMREYNEMGYTTINNVLNSDEVQCVQEHVQWLMQKHPDTPPELLEHWFMRDDPFWISLASHDKLLDIAQQFIGENIAIFASHYVCKMPGSGKAIHWHQDGSYWPLQPMQVVSLWLAVDDSTIENGCMQVISESHEKSLSITGLSANEFNENVNTNNNIELSEKDKSKIKNIQLSAGSVSIHHPMLIHGSMRNDSNQRRCGLTLRYIPTTTQVVIDDPIELENVDIKYGSVYLARGTCHAPNHYRTVPKFDRNKHFLPSVHCDFVNKYCI